MDLSKAEMHKKLDSMISIHPDVKKQVPGEPPGRLAGNRRRVRM